MTQRKKYNEGFAALLTAVIIAAVLTGLAFTVSSSEFSARINALNQIFKRQSIALAGSCVDMALLKLEQNYVYGPAVGGDTISVGDDSCTIVSVVHDIEDAITHQKKVTITARASFRGSWTTIETQVSVHNPSFAPSIIGLKNISIISSHEITP